MILLIFVTLAFSPALTAHFSYWDDEDLVVHVVGGRRDVPAVGLRYFVNPNPIIMVIDEYARMAIIDRILVWKVARILLY